MRTGKATSQYTSPSRRHVPQPLWRHVPSRRHVLPLLHVPQSVKASQSAHRKARKQQSEIHFGVPLLLPSSISFRQTHPSGTDQADSAHASSRAPAHALPQMGGGGGGLIYDNLVCLQRCRIKQTTASNGLPCLTTVSNCFFPASNRQNGK
jgi:hypothetical protein